MLVLHRYFILPYRCCLKSIDRTMYLVVLFCLADNCYQASQITHEHEMGNNAGTGSCSNFISREFILLNK